MLLGLYSGDSWEEDFMLLARPLNGIRRPVEDNLKATKGDGLAGLVREWAREEIECLGLSAEQDGFEQLQLLSWDSSLFSQDEFDEDFAWGIMKRQDDEYDFEPSLLWGLWLVAIEVGVQLQWFGLITKKGIGATGSYL